MIPSLQSVYEALLARAVSAPYVDLAADLRRAFEERCGGFDNDHPAREARDRAAWEDVLVRGGLAEKLAPELADPAQQDAALSLTRAQRGVFVFERLDGAVIAQDLWSGAEFVLAPDDDVAKSLPLESAGADSPVCQARLLGRLEGCIELPGTLYHPTDARPALKQVLQSARERGMTTDGALDAVLKMEHTFRTLSRVKVGYAYRAAMLPS
jgi:hypothetical protein